MQSNLFIQKYSIRTKSQFLYSCEHKDPEWNFYYLTKHSCLIKKYCCCEHYHCFYLTCLHLTRSLFWLAKVGTGTEKCLFYFHNLRSTDKAAWIQNLTQLHIVTCRLSTDVNGAFKIRVCVCHIVLTWSSSPPPSSSYLRMLSLTSSSGSMSSCLAWRSLSRRFIHTTNSSTRTDRQTEKRSHITKNVITYTFSYKCNRIRCFRAWMEARSKLSFW